MKKVDTSSELQELRKIQANKKCFDCNQGGTTYAVPELGIFLCSICGGIHREFNHRVKGLSTCNFTEAEVEKLRAFGNEKAAAVWMAKHDPRQYPIPDLKEANRLKDFLRLKYLEKRFYEFKEVPAEGPKHEERRSVDAGSNNDSGFINLIDNETPELRRKSDVPVNNDLFQASFPNGTFQAQRVNQNNPPPFTAFQPPNPQGGSYPSQGSFPPANQPIITNPQNTTQSVPPNTGSFTPTGQSVSAFPNLYPNSGSFTPTGQPVSSFPQPYPNPTNANTFTQATHPNPGFASYPHPTPSYPNQTPPIYNQTYPFNPASQVPFNPAYPSHPTAPGLISPPQYTNLPPAPYTQFQSIPQGMSPGIMPNNQQVFFSKSSDPFEQLIEEEKQRKLIQQATRNQPTPQQQLLMQQFSVQAQLYERNNGVPFPYSFQQWVSMSSQEIRPQSKNPFNGFG